MKISVHGSQLNLPLAVCGLIVLPALVLLLAACANQDAGVRLPATVSGRIMTANGPAANAIVQVQGTANKTTTAEDGSFTLHGEGLGGFEIVTVTAWADKHFIGWVHLDPNKPIWKTTPTGDTMQTGTNVAITLQPLFNEDNHTYSWFKFEGLSGAAACGACHREYPEWQADAHAKSATNPQFISVYRGTNLEGKKGQLTQLASEGKVMPPDPALPDYGPGFRLDNQERAGNCASCHTPLASKTPTQNGCGWSGCHTSLTADRAETIGKDIRGVTPVGMMGIAEEGITCEFCHVIGAVKINPATGLPYDDMPGIQSMELLRPPEGHKQFLGSLTDANREQVSYSPLQSQSELCAPCHYGVMGGVVADMRVTGGVVVYNSYGEWLNSPYSDPKTGQTCQDCHMPPKDTQYSVPPELGGVARDYGAYHDHTMTSATSQSLLWNAVTMNSSAERQGQTLQVQVSVINDKTGHAVPTDAPIRSMMLVVEALDADGKPLPLQQGPTLPEWTGNYAGQAGRAFAKLLRDKWSGEMPTAAYWREVELVEDTRILPLATDATTYSFQLPAGSAATVNVKLIYRRAFQKLAQQKGWPDADSVMAEATISIAP